MEVQKVPLREIKIDLLARELATSEEAQPYLDYFKKFYSNDAAGIEAALQVLRTCRLKSDTPGECFRPSSGHLQTSMMNTLGSTFQASPNPSGWR
jgi:hypothetical protein